MKTKSLIIVATFIGFMVNLESCTNCSGNKSKIVLEDVTVDEKKFDEYDSQFEQQDSLFKILGKGSTWKTWKKLHKECMKAEWLKSPYYFGVSNTVNLGSIVDKNFDLQRTLDATNGFNEEELKTIINLGNFTTCSYYQELTMSLNTFFQSDFNFSSGDEPDLVTELKIAISNNKTTKVKVDNWRVNNLKEDNLMDYLRDIPESDIKKKNFLKTLTQNKHKILVKVIEIKGFTSLIELETDISTELEAKLKEGVISTMGNGGVEAKFKYKNKRTIEVQSGGNFYVFGKFKKAKKVVE